MSHVRLIQHTPVESLSTQMGALVEQARSQTERLVSTLKQLDEVREKLRDQESVDITVDLGDVGNAAAIARRQVADNSLATHFELPRSTT